MQELYPLYIIIASRHFGDPAGRKSLLRRLSEYCILYSCFFSTMSPPFLKSRPSLKSSWAYQPPETNELMTEGPPEESQFTSLFSGN